MSRNENANPQQQRGGPNGGGIGSSPEDVLRARDGVFQTSVMGGTASPAEHEDAAELFDRINIFHDAKNCTVPHHAFANGSKLFEAVLREALEIGTNKVLAANTAIPGRAHVSWALVQNEDSKNAMTIHDHVLKALISRGVSVHRPHGKIGSTDIQLFGLLDRELNRLRDIPEQEQRRNLEVILTADVDCAHHVRELTKTHATVVLINKGNCSDSLNDIVKRGQKKNSNPTWEHLVRSVSEHRDGKWAWVWDARDGSRNQPNRPDSSSRGDTETSHVSSARTSANVRTTSNANRFSPTRQRATHSQEYTWCDRVIKMAKVLYLKKLGKWDKLVHDVKEINQQLSIWYIQSKIDPMNAILRVPLNGYYHEDEKKRIKEKVDSLLTNTFGKLTSTSFTTSASKEECLSSERLALAKRKGTVLWVPEKGKDSDPSGVSSVLIQVPKGWKKQQVLDQAKKMAEHSGVTISDVTEPTKAEKQLPEYRQSSALYWSVSLGNAADPEVKRRLIKEGSESVDGVSVKFIGDSTFAYRKGEVTLVVLVTHEGNEQALEEIKETYPNTTRTSSWGSYLMSLIPGLLTLGRNASNN